MCDIRLLNKSETAKFHNQVYSVGKLYKMKIMLINAHIF